MLNNLSFRKATAKEQDLIRELWGEKLQSEHKQSRLLTSFIWVFVAIAAIGFLYFLGTSDLSDPIHLFSFAAFAVVAISLVLMLTISNKDLKKVKNHVSTIGNVTDVADVVIRNMRFVMDYNHLGQSGFADAYSVNCELISSSVYIPEDFAFMIEMTAIDCPVAALLFVDNKTNTLFAVPTTGGVAQ